MRVLVACEFSGIVREAFRALGHDAWSCDLLPCEHKMIGYHLQGDVFKVANLPVFDLMIAHPPCTYLCNSGVRWLAPEGKLNPERHKLMVEACDFFAALYNAPVERIAIENPIMHKYARNYLREQWGIPRFSQSIQPWQFGHGEVKRSCFWLQHLDPLRPTQIVDGRKPTVHWASPGPERAMNRSRTLPGIAEAMAAQWGIGCAD